MIQILLRFCIASGIRPKTYEHECTYFPRAGCTRAKKRRLPRHPLQSLPVAIPSSKFNRYFRSCFGKAVRCIPSDFSFIGQTWKAPRHLCTVINPSRMRTVQNSDSDSRYRSLYFSLLRNALIVESALIDFLNEIETENQDVLQRLLLKLYRFNETGNRTLVLWQLKG